MKNFVVVFSVTVFALANCVRVPLNGRIIRGTSTTIEKVPFLAAIKINGDLRCGGSIIERNVVLTTASCVNNIPVASLTITHGSTNVDAGIIHEVVKIEIHPNYNDETSMNNIALLKLKTPIEYTDKSQPIHLATKRPAVYSTVVISGFGTVNSLEFVTTLGALQSAKQRIVSKEDCQLFFNSRITDDMICGVGFNFATSGRGDGGGPVVQDSLLVGVISFNHILGNGVLPNVYASVVDLRDFIEANII